MASVVPVGSHLQLKGVPTPTKGAHIYKGDTALSAVELSLENHNPRLELGPQPK